MTEISDSQAAASTRVDPVTGAVVDDPAVDEQET